MQLLQYATLALSIGGLVGSHMVRDPSFRPPSLVCSLEGVITNTVQDRGARLQKQCRPPSLSVGGDGGVTDRATSKRSLTNTIDRSSWALTQTPAGHAGSPLEAWSTWSTWVAFLFFGHAGCSHHSAPREPQKIGKKEESESECMHATGLWLIVVIETKRQSTAQSTAQSTFRYCGWFYRRLPQLPKSYWDEPKK